MAKKEYIDRPADKNDGEYKIDVTAIAPMNEIPHVKKASWTKTTGKEEEGKESVITYQDLDLGMIINAEIGGSEQDIQH